MSRNAGPSSQICGVEASRQRGWGNARHTIRLTSCKTAPTRCMANEPSRLDSKATRRLRSALSCSAEALASWTEAHRRSTSGDICRHEAASGHMRACMMASCCCFSRSTCRRCMSSAWRATCAARWSADFTCARSGTTQSAQMRAGSETVQAHDSTCSCACASSAVAWYGVVQSRWGCQQKQKAQMAHPAAQRRVLGAPGVGSALSERCVTLQTRSRNAPGSLTATAPADSACPRQQPARCIHQGRRPEVTRGRVSPGRERKPRSTWPAWKHLWAPVLERVGRALRARPLGRRL